MAAWVGDAGCLIVRTQLKQTHRRSVMKSGDWSLMSRHFLEAGRQRNGLTLNKR